MTDHHHLAQRSISALLSAILTLAMLGSIDQLARRDGDSPQWGRQAVPLQQQPG